MTKYRCSDGSKIEKSVLDRKVREAKQEVLKVQCDLHGFNFCEECKRSGGTYLDCSHIEGVDSCQKNGRAEKAFDVSNIRILCRECHSKFDKLNIQNPKSFNKA